MGCNSSKSDDIQKDRKRIQTAPVAVNNAVSSPMPNRTTKPVGISISSKIDENIDPNMAVYGTSHTDRRYEETDFLKNILEKTQSNFIDVYQKHNVIDEKYNEDKHNNYQKNINVNIASNKNVLSSLLLLPTPYYTSNSNNELLKDMATSSGITSSDKEFMATCLQNVHDALKEMTIKRTEPLVVSFQQFSSNKELLTQQ